MQMTKSSYRYGEKFSEDGRVLEFPGNTIICSIHPQSRQFHLLAQISQQFKAQSWAKKFFFLPPSSYHMTVFEGVCDLVRQPERWTNKFPLNAPLEEVDLFFMEAWKGVEQPMKIEMGYFKMKTGSTLGVELLPSTPEMERKVRAFRDACCAAFGIKQPDHATYKFHITIAYRVNRLSWMDQALVQLASWTAHQRLKAQFGLLALGAPELAFFADMTHFAPTRQSAQRNCRE